MNGVNVEEGERVEMRVWDDANRLGDGKKGD